jgi:hypothetical protein
MSRSNTIARATAVIAVFTLLSKVLGFIREMALACVFGASAATDAYLVAYTVPNVVFAVLGGALTVTYPSAVPVRQLPPPLLLPAGPLVQKIHYILRRLGRPGCHLIDELFQSSR